MKFTTTDITHFYGEEPGKTGRIRPGYYEYLVFPFSMPKWRQIIARIKNEPDVKKGWNGRLPDNLVPYLTVKESKKVFSIPDPNDYTFDEVDYYNFTEAQERLHNKLTDNMILRDVNYRLENPEEFEDSDDAD